MFFTYLRRELRRRRKAALVVASGLALGIALVIVVSSVSSGMEKAQGKVLQSLYGLGTDMTVTKAAAPATSTSQRPRFNFDANDNGSTKEQSSDRVMVQGFQTLAASTVTKVDSQKGVADSVGGLSLQVIRGAGARTPSSPRRAVSRAAAPTSTSTTTRCTAPMSPSPPSAR
jgi:ABC-type lipoprotein release transport system permease subunit